MKARIKGKKKIIEVEVLRPRMYCQRDKYGRVVEDFDEGELELLQEPTTTSDHWKDVRERAAIAAMQGLLAHCGDVYTEPVIVREAVMYADLLVSELKGE